MSIQIHIEMHFVVNLAIIIHFAVRNKDKCIHKIFEVLLNIDNRTSGVYPNCPSLISCGSDGRNLLTKGFLLSDHFQNQHNQITFNF